MELCFTVDWEDWYHGLGMPPAAWKHLPRRIHTGHYKLLELLARHRVKATYFLLGTLMEEFPELVKEIQAEGHELACHTFSHPFVAHLTPEAFRQEIQLCKEQLKPFSTSYRGFRAPYFSIKQQNIWALDILKEEGFCYDSSIFPGNTFRAGIAGFGKDIQCLPNGLLEFPISNFPVAGVQFGVGGAYCRTLPYPYFKRRLQQLLQVRPALFYFHPWELDEDQPYVRGLKHRAVHTHYHNLHKTAGKMERLFSDFAFVPMSQILARAEQQILPLPASATPAL